MQTLTVRSIETKAHKETKMMFWFLFASSRGATTRIRIMKLLKNQPCNTHRTSKELSMEYKAIKHHLEVLENNNLVGKFGTKYGATYYPSQLFEENVFLFEEITSKTNV